MEKKVYVYASWDKWEKQFNYSVLGYSTDSKDYIPVCEKLVEFDSLADKDLRLQLALQLGTKQKEVRADAENEINEIQAQINELLALEDHSND